jgi:hypothetical protein
MFSSSIDGAVMSTDVFSPMSEGMTSSDLPAARYEVERRTLFPCSAAKIFERQLPHFPP